MTRQAVYDNLQRSKDLLEHYEENLGMYAHFKRRQDIISELKDRVKDDEALRLIEVLEKLD